MVFKDFKPVMKAKWCQHLQFFSQKGAKRVLQKKFFVFRSSQTSLLYIVGKLAEGGSLAVPVGISDM